MARAMWKAELKIGDASLPVKLYAAVTDRDVRFRLLHAKDRTPVQQRMVDPRDCHEVQPTEIRRGLEVEKGVFVVLREDEVRSVIPEPSRAIEVTQFVPRGSIDLGWYERPYWLGPDDSEQDYFALAAALAETERLGIAHWVLRGKRYFGALEARDQRLSLVSMHSADEVVSADQIERPSGSTITKGEQQLAEQLVAALDERFDPKVLHDDYRERVEKLIAAKAEGRQFAVEEAPPPSAPSDLRDALRQSLRAAKERGRAA
jgi:DNA end-binding protein Ku